MKSMLKIFTLALAPIALSASVATVDMEIDSKTHYCIATNASSTLFLEVSDDQLIVRNDGSWQDYVSYTGEVETEGENTYFSFSNPQNSRPLIAGPVLEDAPKAVYMATREGAWIIDGIDGCKVEEVTKEEYNKRISPVLDRESTMMESVKNGSVLKGHATQIQTGYAAEVSFRIESLSRAGIAKGTMQSPEGIERPFTAIVNFNRYAAKHNGGDMILGFREPQNTHQKDTFTQLIFDKPNSLCFSWDTGSLIAQPNYGGSVWLWELTPENN